MKRNGEIIFLTLFLSLAFAAELASAKGERPASGEAAYCLGCHEKPGPVARFENHETMPVQVDAFRFRSSVHVFLGCSGCHSGFSTEKHPRRTFKSWNQYRIKACLECRRCHSEEAIRKRPVHERLFREEEKGKITFCTDCHGIHSIMPVRGGKRFDNERQYCLGCHAYASEMRFRNGDVLSIKVDIPSLDSSAHGSLTCSDCHFGFSSEEHPKRNFKTLRDYSIASSDTCRRCHFDKYTKTLDSIHFTSLSKGNLNAPVCSDCHGSHSIPHAGKDRTAVTRRCEPCHQEIYESYRKSVHGAALFNARNRDVPVCTDCHNSHDIRDPRTLSYHETIPDKCGSCHGSPAIMTKYGLSTEVVKTYLADFHGVTLSFYKKEKETSGRPARPIAVCTDCHGTHNIERTTGSGAAVIKTNLVKRCRSCHKTADENFPEAWLPHYAPSLEKAPLVFILEGIYNVLMPAMLLGLFLQILLHAWRYATNR